MFLSLLLLGISLAFAGPRERAKAIHDRLIGVPATEADLDVMDDMAPINAAIYAMTQGENSRYFATVTLKNFAAPWTNRDQTAVVPVNDYTTLVIGMVINQVPFNQILSIDRLYVRSGAPLPTASSIAHYEALETRMMEQEFDPMAELVDVPQSTAGRAHCRAKAAARNRSAMRSQARELSPNARSRRSSTPSA